MPQSLTKPVPSYANFSCLPQYGCSEVIRKSGCVHAHKSTFLSPFPFPFPPLPLLSCPIDFCHNFLIFCQPILTAVVSVPKCFQISMQNSDVWHGFPRPSSFDLLHSLDSCLSHFLPIRSLHPSPRMSDSSGAVGLFRIALYRVSNTRSPKF